METSERPHTITHISSFDIFNPFCSFLQKVKKTQPGRNGQNILVNRHLNVFVSNFILKKITRDSHHVTGKRILAVTRTELKRSRLKLQHKSCIVSLCLHLLALKKNHPQPDSDTITYFGGFVFVSMVTRTMQASLF